MRRWRWRSLLAALGLAAAALASQHASGAGERNALGEPDNATEVIQLLPIAGTPNYRLVRQEKGAQWFPERELKLDSCVRKARCEPLDRAVCLGARLPYDRTSVRLTYYGSQALVQRRLELYRELINVPKCWAVVQPLLCAIFMPKCESIQGQDVVYLPSYEMCKITMEPCAIVYNTSYFPSFLKCNETLFPARCDNPAREMRFNTSGRCPAPLVPTEKVQHFYEGIAGCGVPCRDPLYTEDEHQQIHRLVAWGAGVSLALSLLTVATFLVDWRSANKYPALVIFYINVCFAVASMGWLVQFGVGSRDDIVCSKDGTRRRGEPSAEENLSCVVVFVLVYYFMMAACVWFVIFTYAWHMSFRALGKIQERIDKKAAYFHLVAWSLPLVLTITTMALGEIDGSSITGICFVGYVNGPVRGAMLLAPLCAVLLLAGYFLGRGVLSLVAVRAASRDVMSPRAADKIRQTILRCSLTAALVAVFVCVTFACHLYEFRTAHLWADAFRRNMVCRLERGVREGAAGGGGAAAAAALLLLRRRAHGLVDVDAHRDGLLAAVPRQKVRVLGGGGGGCAARAQARADRARVPAARRVRGARPPVHLAGRLAAGPGGAVPRHRRPAGPRRRRRRRELRAVVVVGGEPAALRAAPRRARAPARAPLALLHARPPQLAGLPDKLQPAPRVGGVAPQLPRQPAVGEDRRDEDKGGPAAQPSRARQAARAPLRRRAPPRLEQHREPHRPLRAAGARQQRAAGVAARPAPFQLRLHVRVDSTSHLH